MATIYGRVRAVGAAEAGPGADAQGERPIAVDADGNLYVRFATGGASAPAVTRAVHLASAVLPAAGLFTTAQAKYTLPAGLSSITFWITYTRDATGADTGFPRARMLWDNGTEEAADLVIDETIDSLSAPYARRKVYAAEFDFPAPPSDAAVTYQITFAIPKGATKARLLLAEAGDVAKPGTALIALTGGY